jgi:hypothetical protein
MKALLLMKKIFKLMIKILKVICLKEKTKKYNKSIINSIKMKFINRINNYFKYKIKIYI